MHVRIQRIDNQWKLIQDVREDGLKTQRMIWRLGLGGGDSHWDRRHWKFYLDLTHNTQSNLYPHKSPSNLECIIHLLTTQKFHSNSNSHNQTSQTQISNIISQISQLSNSIQMLTMSNKRLQSLRQFSFHKWIFVSHFRSGPYFSYLPFPCMWRKMIPSWGYLLWLSYWWLKDPSWTL